MAQNNAINSLFGTQFLAYLSADANSQTGDGTIYKIAFNTVTGLGYDIASNYNTGTSTFTAPLSGVYMFGISIGNKSIAAGHTSGNLALYKNGSILYTPINLNPANTNNGGSLQMTCQVIAQLAATDTIDWRVQISGSTKTTGIWGGSNNSLCWGCLVN